MPRYSRLSSLRAPRAAGSFTAAATLLCALAAGGPPALANPPANTWDDDPALNLAGDPVGGFFLGDPGRRKEPRAIAFVRSTDADWVVAWDDVLDTPVLVHPVSSWILPRQEPVEGEDAILTDVKAFVHAYRDFLGVDLDGLAPLDVQPFADGYHISAMQMHEGLPVRGSAFRMRVNGDRTVRSLTPYLARNLPPLKPGDWTEEEIRDIAASDGIVEILVAVEQVVFPEGPESAVRAWDIVGTGADGEEMESVYSAVTSERLYHHTTTLYFDPECDGEGYIVADARAAGLYPDPDNVFTKPGDYEGFHNYQRIPAVTFLLGIDQGPCKRQVSCVADKLGRCKLRLDAIRIGDFYPLNCVLGNDRLEVTAGLPDMLYHFVGEFNKPDRKTVIYNTERSEYQAHHLMAYHQVYKATDWIDELLEDQGYLYWGQGPEEPMKVWVSPMSYGHAYRPFSRVMLLFNDEIQPKDEEGRWRKIVPTIIYHECGHEFVAGLTADLTSRGLHDGFSDAFSGFVSRDGRIGYCYEKEGRPERYAQPVPGGDPWARDLDDDTTLYPDNPRTTVAGAFWALWQTTAQMEVGEDGTREWRSLFAEGAMARYLAARRVSCNGDCGGVHTLRYDALIGLGVLLEADCEALGGDNDFSNGFPHEEEFWEAFGRRNLIHWPFIRGDANLDAGVDISDAIGILQYLFLGAPETTCLDAMDVDDNGEIQLTDAVALLDHLFRGVPGIIPMPYAARTDKTKDDSLACWYTPYGRFPYPAREGGGWPDAE